MQVVLRALLHLPPPARPLAQVAAECLWASGVFVCVCACVGKDALCVCISSWLRSLPGVRVLARLCLERSVAVCLLCVDGEVWLCRVCDVCSATGASDRMYVGVWWGGVIVCSIACGGVAGLNLRLHRLCSKGVVLRARVEQQVFVCVVVSGVWWWCT